MIATFEYIEYLSKGDVDFYTVRLDDQDLTEIEKFDDKDFPDHSEEVEVLYNIVKRISRTKARIHYFKTNEGAANALPLVANEIMDSNKVDWGVRLYCVRLTDYLVILLNGGIKTKKNAQHCKSVGEYFSTADKIAKRINKLLGQGELKLQKRHCLHDISIEI